MENFPPFVFVVDTTDYAGNFYDALCVFLTGHVVFGDYEKIVTAFVEAHPDCFSRFGDALVSVGAYMSERYCDSWPTPGYYNDGNGHVYKAADFPADTHCFPAYNSVGIYFKERPDALMTAFLKERATEYAAAPKGADHVEVFTPPPFQILGFRLLERTLVVNETAV